jgi:hypothetical protein
MNRVQKTALLYLAAFLLLGYGYAIGRFQVFPHSYIEPLVKDFQNFAKGDVLEKDSTVMDKFTSDLGLSFDRWTYDYPALAAENAIPVDLELTRDGLPVLYIDEDHREGYRLIFGAFGLPDSFWGGLLLDPEGKVLHTWNLSTRHLPARIKKDHLKNLYGLHVFPDGSIIYSMQEKSGGLVKVDGCSEIVWSLPGEYHHTVSATDDGHVWSFTGEAATFNQDMVKVSVETGEIVQTIDMTEVRNANPNLNIWNLVLFSDEEKGHMTHGNDIEPLPAALVEDFPQFERGDLLISYASTNLIFVLDPDDLTVKWWRVGLSDWNHDPDWEPGGTISIYSNNFRSVKPHSDITVVDPTNMAFHVAVEGADYDFLSEANGRQQLTPYGTRYVTSSRQGWAFEVDAEGKLVSSFLNTLGEEGQQALHLGEALRFREDYFDNKFWKTCNGGSKTPTSGQDAQVSRDHG